GQAPRPRKGLPVPARLPGAPCRAGVPPGPLPGQALLRALRPGRGAAGRPRAGRVGTPNRATGMMRRRPTTGVPRASTARRRLTEVVERTVSNPLIKLAAFTAGAQAAIKRMRGRKE